MLMALSRHYAQDGNPQQVRNLFNYPVREVG